MGDYGNGYKWGALCNEDDNRVGTSLGEDEEGRRVISLETKLEEDSGEWSKRLGRVRTKEIVGMQESK